MTSARMALVTALALVFVSVLSQAAVHQFEENRDSGGLHLVREDGSFVEIAYRIESLRLDDVHTGGEALKQLTVPGLFLPGPEGAPDLPGFSRFIAIPEGATARFEVVRTKTETIAGVDLAPGVRVPFENDDSPLVYRKDPAIYSVDALYPLEPITLSAPTELRGVDVVVLAVTPFQYNPVTKELLVSTSLEIRVSFEGGGRFGEDRLRSRHWEPILEQHLLNYASLPVIDFAATPSRDEYGEYEYVIITPDDPVYTSWADSLRQWRTLQGIDTGVVTLTDIGSGTVGDIEDWIDDAYTTWVTPPAAILFLGDYVPSGSTDGVTSPIYDAYCVSDNIYADVDGENLPDIVVSRMTATPATIGDLVSKTIDYERHPVTDPGFYDHPVVAGGYQSDRWFILCTEIIYGFWTNVLGKSPVREYAIVDLPPGSQWSTYWRTQAIIDYFGPGPGGLGYVPATPEYLNDWGGNASRINADINAGAFILQHRDHGGTSGWGEPSYHTVNLAALENDALPFVFSINCLTGKFNLGGDCFAEAFHRYPQRALGVVAATEVSYSYYNDVFTWGIYDSMWPDFDPYYPRSGRHVGSSDLRPAFGSTSAKYYLNGKSWTATDGKALTYHLFHAHCDAFTTLFSEVPEDLTVAHEAEMPSGASEFEVTADEGSIIALTVGDQIIGVGEGTGAPLAVPVGPVPGPATLKVVVTKPNHLRYTGTVAIPPSIPWEDVTEGPLGAPLSSRAAVWGDYDGDFDPDLYVVAGSGDTSRLFRNDDGVFTEVEGAALAGDGYGRSAAWGDYDNDGDLDLYVVNDGAPNALLRNVDGAFEDATGESGPVGDGSAGRDAAWADYDGDGHLDLYLSNADAGNRLFRNLGDGTFEDATDEVTGDAGNCTGIAWGDYDGDGRLDLYLVKTVANRLLRNAGDGTFEDVTATAGAVGDAGDGRGAAWGDYDNDGDLDLYVANGSGGANSLLGNNGDGTFDDVTVDALADTGESQGVAWGDYDNDGDLDLYFANWGTENRLLRNDGEAFTDVTDDVVGNPWGGTGVAWSDYDRDGDLDLYLANDDHDNVLVRNAYPNTFHWLHARLVGVASNASGVGARVRVHAGGSVQIREVGGDASYGSGNSLTVEFGLGTAVHVDSVVVSWPSGLVDVHRGLAVDQLVTFTEDVPPPAPADVTATPVEAGVEVVWSPVGVPDLDRYRVERDTTDAFGDGTIVFETQDTTHVDFPILDEDTYFYRVFARDQAHKLSAASDTVSAVPLQTPPPRPSGLSTLGGDLMVTLSWRAVDVPDVDHYRVERDTSTAFGDGMLVSTTTDTFLVDSPLVMGEEYFYRAITIDLSGLTSGPSDTLAYVAHGIPPSVPLRFDVDSEYDVISLLWDENPEPDVVGYVVYRDTVPDLGPADSLAFVASPAYNDTSCPRYGIFWYCVSARDLSGLTSVYSDTAAGLRAPGGATFVDCASTGFQNGSFDYPYGSIQSGVEHVSRGGAVIVLPGTCDGDITLTTDLVLLGLGGSDVTLIEVPAGVGITAAGLTDSARIEGFTVDGLGMGDEGLYCLDSDLLVTGCVFRDVNVGASFEGGSEPVVAACRFESNNEGVVVADSSSPFFSGNVFTGSVVAGMRTVGSVGPVLGGSLEDANDFTDFSLFAILNTSPVEVSAEYNYWGDDCVLAEWFLGPVDYVPWTDETHTEEYTECQTGIVDDGVPVAYALGRCYPNPFNPVTRIQYDVPSPRGRVALRVFSASGRLVRTLCDGSVPPGRHVAVWDGRDEAGARVASGVYFCRMEAGQFTERRKLVLLK